MTQVLADGPYELSETLSLAFLYLLDMPETRKYVRAGHDLEVTPTFVCSALQFLIGQGGFFGVHGSLPDQIFGV